MPSLMEWRYAQQNAPQYYWLATAAAVAHPTSRRVGLRMASFGLRATANMAFASGRALLGTSLLRGGSATLGNIGAAAAAGYALGVVVGTSVSYIVWGDEGASDAINLYTGQVSFDKYVRTVGSAIKSKF